jgi:4-hydroxyphenylpyruvate dioxygenase
VAFGDRDAAGNSVTAAFALNPFFINTVVLGGSTKEKLVAAERAGFHQVELGLADVDAFAGGIASLRQFLRDHGLVLTDFHSLADFDGACDSVRGEKRAEAIRLLDTAAHLGAGTLLTTSSTHTECLPERIDEDLRWLAREASLRDVRIAYKPLAWSIFNFTPSAAWQCVRRVHEGNLSLVVDAFHLFEAGRDAEDLESIPIGSIAIVQLSDLRRRVDYHHVVETARHERLLPGRGQGCFPLDTILSRLRDRNYRGPIGVEVFNDGLRARDPTEVALEAMAGLRSLWPN